jgi:hypothetical protein
MGVVYHQPRLDRFRMLGGTVGWIVIGAIALVESSPAIGWGFLACGVLSAPLSLRLALPGNYVRLTQTGVELGGWRSRRPLVPWSEIVEIEVISIGLGRTGYRYPRLILADGKKAPLMMLTTSLAPTSAFSRLFGKARHHDPHFDEKVAQMREHVAEQHGSQ